MTENGISGLRFPGPVHLPQYAHPLARGGRGKITCWCDRDKYDLVWTNK